MRTGRWVLAALGLAIALRAQPAVESPWRRFDFLIGNWIGVAGEKDTPLGAGQGAFSFQFDLNQKIIIRRNQAAYESGAGHQDLMVIYLENDAPRAIYFDSEGHTIRYQVTFPSADSAVFSSDVAAPGPRYRLSYQKTDGGLNGKFEIAVSGGDYKPYLNWRSKRQ